MKLGDTFGRWTICGEVFTKGKYRYVPCTCICAAQKDVETSNLINGRSTSCGCLRREICRNLLLKHGHGMDTSGVYSVWKNMLQRTNNPKCHDYKYYGGRGITVCDRWANSFADFLADVGERPEGLTFDRIEVNGNYEPGNVRWVTWSVQQKNKRPKEVCCKGHPFSESNTYTLPDGRRQCRECRRACDRARRAA